MPTCVGFNLFLLLLLQGMAVSAQSLRSGGHEFYSDIFESKRKIKVFLPERSFGDTLQPPVVTYLLDAQSEDFWLMATGNINYLVQQYQIVPMIVVGIVSENRSAEFSPQSPLLAEHLRKEVMPLIAKEYQASEVHFLIGHSWGGAFVGNTLFSENTDLFDAYLGIIPSLGAIDGRIFRQADAWLNGGQPLNKFFYCSAGDLGISEEESGEDIAHMDTLIRLASDSTLVWQYEIVKNTDHWSCVIPSINNGLIAISRHYFPDKKVIRDFAAAGHQSIRAHIRDFYQTRQKMDAYAFTPSPAYWESVGDDFRETAAYETAGELYHLAIEAGNDQAVVLHFKLAQCYEALEDKAQTVLYAKKTASLLEVQKGKLKASLFSSLKKETDQMLARWE